MSFGNYLRKKLREKGMSQAQLANELKVTRAMVSRWAKEFSSNPTEKSMRKVIEYFGDDYGYWQNLFYAEKKLGSYLWSNLRPMLREKEMHLDDLVGLSEEAQWRYNGICEYVEIEDVKTIAEDLNCSVERLLIPPADFGYDMALIIGKGDYHKSGSLSISFCGEFHVETTEMEPLIHYGDQVMLKRDFLTNLYAREPKKGDIVVLRDLRDGTYYIRRCDYINGKMLFVANDAQYSPITPDDCEIEGIVAQSMTVFY